MKTVVLVIAIAILAAVSWWRFAPNGRAAADVKPMVQPDKVESASVDAPVTNDVPADASQPTQTVEVACAVTNRQAAIEPVDNGGDSDGNPNASKVEDEKPKDPIAAMVDADEAALSDITDMTAWNAKRDEFAKKYAKMAEERKLVIMRANAKKSPYIADAIKAKREFESRAEQAKNILAKLSKTDPKVQKLHYELIRLRDEVKAANEKHARWKAENKDRLLDPEKDDEYVKLIGASRHFGG